MRKYLGWLSAIAVSLGFVLSVSCSQLASGGGFLEIPKVSKNTNKVKTSTYVFDLSSVPSITIEISSNEWNTLLTNYDKNEKNETMVKADFKFQKGADIFTYQNIGIRLRGNTSRERPEGSIGQMHNPTSPDWHHAHFKLDLDQFNTVGTNFYKLDGFNLKWCKDDPDYAREVYCYNLFQKFGVWTAPLVSYTKVYIKIKEDPTAAYFGIYEMIEPIDERYLKARFPNELENGYLWKCLWGANLETPGGTDIGIEVVNGDNDTLSYRPCYDLKTQKTNFAAAKAQLLAFINNLNTKTGTEFVTWIKSAMDVDLLLRTYAVNDLVGMWDDYWKNNGNNYYLYFDDLGKCYFIPYDYDNTLGTGISYYGNPGTDNIITWGPSSGAVLINKVFGVTEFKNTYIKYVSELINKTNDLFDFVKSTNRIKIWQNLITADVANDTGEDMAISDALFATWTDFNYYKLFSGEVDINFFKTRIVYAQLQLGLPTNANSWTDTGGGDVTAPVFLSTSPYSMVFTYGPYALRFVGKINENGTIYVIAVTNNTTIPSSAQVKAGKDGNGNNAFISGNTAVPANGLYLIGDWFNFGTKENTTYDIYFTAQDSTGNLMSDPTNLEIITPSHSYDSFQDNGGSITLRFFYTGTNFVYLRGSFNSWDLSQPMTEISNDWYELTLNKGIGYQEVEQNDMYKFQLRPDPYDDYWYPDPMNYSNSGMYDFNSYLFW
jgi:spore coat protein CotH